MEKTLIEHQYFTLTGHTEFNINRWHSTNKSSQNRDGFIYSITPVFTYTFKNVDVLNHNLYLETGIGFAFMDSTKIEDREKSTHFQFTDSIGLGFKSKLYQVGYRFTHISNLDIATPNPSIDLHQIQISYKF
ncbi:MAG: acyloxyacyl hydrolase [Sulfurovum sp.]|nr:MAG: acyloxyacyl hydrolase [Sulfurovum sp.]